MRARTTTARAAASVILAGALVLGTAGCTFISQQATLIKYDPSDGVGADIGDVQVRNAIGIISEDGQAISLLVTIVNSGSIPVNLNLQYEEDGEKTDFSKPIPGGSVVSYGTTPDEDQIVVRNAGVVAGQLLPVYVQYGDHPGVQMMVPVLEATGEYADLTPPDSARD